jgi:hypothetical protein
VLLSPQAVEWLHQAQDLTGQGEYALGRDRVELLLPQSAKGSTVAANSHMDLALRRSFRQVGPDTQLIAVAKTSGKLCSAPRATCAPDRCVPGAMSGAIGTVVPNNTKPPCGSSAASH